MTHKYRFISEFPKAGLLLFLMLFSLFSLGAEINSPPVGAPWAGDDATINAGQTFTSPDAFAGAGSVLWTTLPANTGTFNDPTLARPTYDPQGYIGTIQLIITNTGGSPPSDAMTLTIIDYCTPFYATGCTWGDGLTSFQLGTINQTIACTGTPAYYHDFTTVATDVAPGSTETLTVISGYSSHHVDVWIDFNDNFVFEASETVVDELICTTTGVPFTANIIIPSNAPPGPHTMRYRTNWLNNVNDPCSQYSYGNAGDFTINVVSGCPPLNVGSISADQTACYNQSPSELIGVAPSGGLTPYTYQWQNSTDNVIFADITGATSLNYQPGGLTVSTYFRLNQTSDGGCETVTTDTVTIAVYGEFTAGSILTSGETICYGGDPSIIGSSTDAHGGDGNITYEWQKSTFSSSTGFAVINGATSTSYDPPAGLTATTWYRRYAHDGTCHTSFDVSAGTWMVTVYGEFTAGSILTSGETICYGGDPSIIGSSTDAHGGDGNITYEWQKSTFSSSTGFAVINGATSTSYDPPAGLTATTWYRRYAHDGTCHTSFDVSAGTWMVTVNPLPIVNCPGNQNVCIDAAIIDLTTFIDPAGGTFTGAVVNGTFFDPLIGANTYPINYSYTDGNGCTNNCAFDITVNPLPIAGISSNSPVCLGGDLDLDASPSGMASYSWVGPGGWTSDQEMNTFSPGVSDYIGNSYSLTVTDVNGCTDYTTFDVIVADPQIQFPASPFYTMKPETLLLDPGVFDTYLWQNNSSAPYFDVQDFGTYALTVTEYGCQDVASVDILECQDIEMHQGWGFFSTYINTSESFDQIMAECISHNDGFIIKNGVGNVFSNQYAIPNLIGNHSVGQGYQYWMAAPQTLTVFGSAVEPENTILNLNAGYNILGYLRKSAAPVDQIMSPIESLINIMKDESGNVYWYVTFNGSSFWINQIGDLEPGKAYQLKLSIATPFTFPSNGTTFSKSEINITQPSYFAAPVSTGNNMTLGIPENAWSIAVNVGDELGVFNQNGDLVGSGVYNNDNMAISLWGDNEVTKQTNGLADKEVYTLQLWNSLTGATEELIVTEWVEGNGTYGENDIAIVGKLAIVEESGLSLNNYPNPFKDVTTIGFNIPEDGKVRIELYNSIGKRLEVITDREYTAGTHEVQFNAGKLAVGNYFIKLDSNGQTLNKAVKIVR